MQTKQDPREPVLLMALNIMLHAKLRVLASRKNMHGTVLLTAEGASKAY